MTKIRKWTYTVLCATAWALLYGLFLRLESGVEPTMFASGQQARWWSIVLLYWVIDTAVVLCFAWVVRRPFGLEMPQRFPFFQLAADFAVIILLVHIAWSCTDRYLFPGLVSIGLAVLPKLFLLLAVLWGAVAMTRYRQLANILRRLPEESRP